MSIVDELRTDPESGAKRLEGEYKAGLMTLARRFCADEGDAEELVNRTFAAVVAGIDDYVEQSAFFGWMCQILSHIHSMDMRRKSNRNEVGVPDAGDAPDESSAARLFESVDASILRDAIDRLPRDMRDVLVMHYLMDLPVARVAKFLSLPAGTVKWRLHCARAELGRRLGAATRTPGGKMAMLALLLAAGLAVARGVAGWVVAHAESAADESHAEAAADEPHAEAAEFAEPVSHAESAEFAEFEESSGETEPPPTDLQSSESSDPDLSPLTSTLSPLTSTFSSPTHTLPPPSAPAMKSSAFLAASASLALAAAPAAADQWVYDASAKTLSRGTVVLQNVTASGTSLTIGDNKSNATATAVDLSVGVAGGYAVTKMSSEAFRGNTALLDVVLPDTLASLGGRTFQQCTALTNAVFTGGSAIGTAEFYGCTALKTVSLHPDMSGAWIATFQNCTSLTGDIELPRGVTGMKETFYKTKITSFRTLGTALEYIGYWGNGDGDFRDCSQMTNCVLNPGLKTIGMRVFQGCSALTDIVIPDSVEEFGSGFGSCNSLTNCVMPKNLVRICSRVFSSNTPINVWWRGYPKNGFTFGGADTSDPMWDMYRANIVTNWIRLADKSNWEAAAAAYPDYVQLPPENPRGATGWWKGGYRSSAKTVLRWWYDSGTLVLVK